MKNTWYELNFPEQELIRKTAMALICDVLIAKQSLVANPTQSYGENTNGSTQDFINFAIKND